jgi:hypothetical protein
MLLALPSRLASRMFWEGGGILVLSCAGRGGAGTDALYVSCDMLYDSQELVQDRRNPIGTSMSEGEMSIRQVEKRLIYLRDPLILILMASLARLHDRWRRPYYSPVRPTANTRDPAFPYISMLRRNGTRSSCEPCRKAKVKCDHHSPCCQRCEARGIGASCVYHPAPLHRTHKKQSTQRYRYQNQTGFGVLDLSGDRLCEPALPSTQASSTAPLAETHIYTDAASNAIPLPSPSSFADSGVELNVQSAPTPAGSGYYGSTSYYSVFDRVDHVPAAATTHPQPRGPAGDTLSADVRDDDPSLSRSIQLGSWILQILQHVSIIQSLADTYIRTSQVSPTATLIPMKTVETLHHLAGGDVHALAQKITRNTHKPLQVPPGMHASTFSTLFTGDNLRWEFLGLVFSWAGLSLSMCLLNGKGSATTPDGTSKTSFSQLLTACSDACITLCRQNSHTNDLLSWCLYENLILLTFQHGEASEH